VVRATDLAIGGAIAVIPDTLSNNSIGCLSVSSRFSYQQTNKTHITLFRVANINAFLTARSTRTGLLESTVDMEVLLASRALVLRMLL